MTPTTEILENRTWSNTGARITMRLLLTLDIYYGVAWIAGDSNRTQSGIFIPARSFLDFIHADAMHIYGILMLGLGALAWLMMDFGKSELATRLVITVLTGYWVFWMGLDIASATYPHGSLTAWAAAAYVVIGHGRGCVGSHLLTRRAEGR